MKRYIVLFLLLTVFSDVYSHFGMIVPSDDIVTQKESKKIRLDIKFIHPMEGHYMNMDKPVEFGVMLNGEKKSLLNTLEEKKINIYKTWTAEYKIKKPGNYIFYFSPKPYWEPSEDCYIVHYTKVIVNALGIDTGWDKEIGHKTEIAPLTRPYGLWTGNIFQGVVKLEGNPLPYAEVEVEYYNKEGKIKPKANPFITQLIKADQNGVFSYAMPREGWWGFAALNIDKEKIKYNGIEKEVEIGAVIWVRTYNMN